MVVGLSKRQRSQSEHDILRMPDRSLDEQVEHVYSQVKAISKELGVHPGRVSIGFTRRPDGQVELVMTFPDEVADRIDRLSKLKIAGQDSVILGGIEVQFGDEGPQITAAEPEPAKPLKLWTGEERKRRSKPKVAATPDFP